MALDKNSLLVSELSAASLKLYILPRLRRVLIMCIIIKRTSFTSKT